MKIIVVFQDRLANKWNNKKVKIFQQNKSKISIHHWLEKIGKIDDYIERIHKI